jgi:hypothetical protein
LHEQFIGMEGPRPEEPDPGDPEPGCGGCLGASLGVIPLIGVVGPILIGISMVIRYLLFGELHP